MKVSDFAEKNGLSILCLPDNREIDGCYIGDLLSWVMGRAVSGDAWVTIMQNKNVLAVASLSDVSCVIFAEGVKPDAEIITLAEEKGINLLSSEETAFLIAKRLSPLL